MSDQPMTLQLELPPEITQQDVWELEIQISKVVGITTELREPKDLLTATLLFISMVEPYMVQAATIAGGIQTTRDLARILYDFLHPKKQESDRQRGKNCEESTAPDPSVIVLCRPSSLHAEKPRLF